MDGRGARLTAAASRPYSQAAEDVARRIEGTVLGGQRRYNRVQVSEATGVSRDRASRLWLAMGFAEVGDDELVFTDGDIEALQVWDGLVTRHRPAPRKPGESSNSSLHEPAGWSAAAP